MRVSTHPDVSQRLTAFERSVPSTALAYRFMVRRSLGQSGGASFSDGARDGSAQPEQTSHLPARRALQKRPI